MESRNRGRMIIIVIIRFPFHHSLHIFDHLRMLVDVHSCRSKCHFSFPIQHLSLVHSDISTNKMLYQYLFPLDQHNIIMMFYLV